MDNPSVRDNRPSKFARIGYEILEHPEITSKDIAVYVALSRFADFNDGSCYPGEKKISEIARVGNLRTLRDSLNRLARLGFLVIEHRWGLANTYILKTPGAKVPQVGRTEVPQVVGAKLPHKREPSERKPFEQKKSASALDEIIEAWQSAHTTKFGCKALLTGIECSKVADVMEAYGKDMVIKMLKTYWRFNLDRGTPITMMDFYGKANLLFHICRKKD